jgi:hypothetical protein
MSQLTKGQKRMFAVLMVVILYAVYDIASNWDTYKAYYSNTTIKNKRNKTAAEAANQKINPTENKSYLKDWNEDPFYISGRQTFVKKSSSPPETVLKLKAISYAGENSVIMINDKILKTGDIIEGYRIEKIEQKSVTLNKSGKVLKLFLQ